MSGAVFNSRFLTRLLTSGEEDIEHVSMLKEDISSTACELTMLILSVSVTFNATFLTVASLITKSCQQPWPNTFLFILQGSALADLGYGGRF